MPHELTIRPDGRAEAFFAGDGRVLNPAWHGLGTNVLDAPNAEAALILGGLDWDVDKVSALARYQPDALDQYHGDTGLVQADDFRAIIRRDSHAVLGYVTDDYTPVQNREAFAFLDDLGQKGIVRFESAGSLRGGRRVWVLARADSVREIAPGDGVQPYMLFVTSHDGSSSLRILPTTVRVVCANTLAIALGRYGAGFTVRHDGNVHDRLETISDIIKRALTATDLKLEQAAALVGKTLTNDGFWAYVDEVLPLDPESKRPHFRIAAREAVAWNFYSNPRQNLPGIERTAWAAYNAVSEFADHEGKFRTAESRFVSIMEGGANELKQRAFASALNLV